MTSSLPFRNAIGGVAVTAVSGSYLPLPSFCFVTLLLRILSIKARSEDEGGLYPAPPSSSTAYPNRHHRQQCATGDGTWILLSPAFRVSSVDSNPHSVRNVYTKYEPPPLSHLIRRLNTVLCSAFQMRP